MTQNFHFLFYLFVLLYISFCPATSTVSLSHHPEAKLEFMDYCKFFGYPVQQHKINTEDGYILTYYRIQAQNSSDFKVDLPVVYLQHGFIDSSDTFILNSDPLNNAPAFYFADKGFDVWLGNTRGNKHSREHIIYDPDQNNEFWDFSWQEMSDYDLPAAFDYITKYTQQQKISYIGHSQGTVIMLAALSENNEHIKTKLKSFVAMGPFVSLTHQESLAFSLIDHEALINLLKYFKTYEVFGETWFTSEVARTACRTLNFLCEAGLYLLSDMKPELDNLERMDVVMGHYPSGTSLRDFEHILQMTKNETFQKFDFKNETENFRRYGQISPPAYNLSNVDIPLYLYSGIYDELADLDDFHYLLDKLNGTKSVNVTYIEGGHASFLWGNNMSFLNKILQQIQN